MSLKRLLLISFVLALLVQALSLKCIQCSSVNDADCLRNPSEYKDKDCEDDEQICFTGKDENSTITRGCKGPTAECKAPDCVASDKENGNDHNICQLCDSSDPDCVSLIHEVREKNSICPASTTKCITNIRDDFSLERSCESAAHEKACTSDNKLCQLCENVNCNIGIFPQNRIRCYHCQDGSDCNWIINGQIKSSPCALYKENDECYMYAANETTMKRGCVSDTHNNDKCTSDSQEPLCYKCSQDNCNDFTYKRKQSLLCIQCRSTENDAACMWGQEASSAKDCDNNIPYNAEEMCYTQKLGGVVHRGCFFDGIDLGSCNDENCTTCTGDNGCNSKEEADFTCIRCRQDENPKCSGADAAEIGGQKCRGSVTYETKGCFAGVWRGIVIRGCMIDANAQQLAVCNDKDNKQCDFCPEKDCNVMEKSGAASIYSTFSSFPVVLVISYLTSKVMRGDD